MAIQSLAPVKSLSKSGEVFQQLRDAIWSGELPPGTPLREAHIAKQLNVSQVPVREALLQLEHLGLVVRIQDRSTTVTKLARSEILEMIEVRRHLEQMAFQLAADRITPELTRELKDHLKHMEVLVREKDHFKVAEEDFSFHKAVWRASGNKVLAQTLERLCIVVYAFVSLKRHASNETMLSAIKSHKLLLNALLSQDKRKISKVVHDHLTAAAVLPESLEG